MPPANRHSSARAHQCPGVTPHHHGRPARLPRARYRHELVAEARVVGAGRTAIFTEVDVTTDAGRLVAKGLVTFVVSSPSAAPEVSGEVP